MRTKSVFCALAATFVIVCMAAFGQAKKPQKNEEQASKKATVDGKYSDLLKKLKVPGDKNLYGVFFDYGAYSGTSWQGHNNLPTGYWVYVSPHWYIWKKSKGSTKTTRRPSSVYVFRDAYSALLNKRVRVRIHGEDIKGEVIRNTYYQIVMRVGQRKRVLVNKSQIAYVEWTE